MKKTDGFNYMKLKNFIKQHFEKNEQLRHQRGFPGGSAIKNPSANAGDAGSISGSGRSPRVGSGNPLQFSCLENSMGSDWWATVYAVTKSWTQLSN